MRKLLPALLLASASVGASEDHRITIYSGSQRFEYEDCQLVYYSLTPGISDASYLYATCATPYSVPSKPPGVFPGSQLDEVYLALPEGAFYSLSCSVTRSVAESALTLGSIEMVCGG